MLYSKISAISFAILCSSLSFFDTRQVYAQSIINESSGPSAPSRSKWDAMYENTTGRSTISDCNAPYVDFRGTVKGFHADVVLTRNSDSVMGAIIKNGGQTSYNVGQTLNFEILDCGENAPGRGARGYGLVVSNPKTGKNTIGKIIMISTGFNFKPVLATDPNTYKVISTLRNIYINDPGFGYRQNEKLHLIPDKGVILETVIINGEVKRIDVVKEGSGFVMVPETKFKPNKSGYNFKIGSIYFDFDAVPSNSNIDENDILYVVKSKPVNPSKVECKDGIDCVMRNLGY
jgi:hypothetical protein